MVTGLDLSKHSIHYAQQFENDALSFFNHDMRMPFRINYFDTVMNLFTSFGYFENEKDNLRTLQSAAASLKKSGILVIDFMNSEKVLKEMVPQENKDVCGIAFNIRKKVRDGFLVKEIDFSDNREQFSFIEKVKILRIEDFKNYFALSGLELKDVFGDYLLGPYSAENSERLILTATKI